MPVYDYDCRDCGPFTLMRPMVEHDQAGVCPDCRGEAPRAFFVMPNLATMSSTRRKANAVNERSAHAPQTLDQRNASHGAGCGCCTGLRKRQVTRTSGGAKSFPTARPWMISH
jgi:putative FmdB family regulatory protein